MSCVLKDDVHFFSTGVSFLEKKVVMDSQITEPVNCLGEAPQLL